MATLRCEKNESDNEAKVDGIIALIIAMHCSLENVNINAGGGFGSLLA